VGTGQSIWAFKTGIIPHLKDLPCQYPKLKQQLDAGATRPQF